MGVCPKCGHEDAPCWRSAAFHTEHSYAQLSTLEMFEPELWEAIKDKPKGEVIKLLPYVYWKSIKSETVRRCWVEDFKVLGKSGSPQERVQADRSRSELFVRRIMRAHVDGHEIDIQ